VGKIAVVALVAVAEVEISKERVVEEALEDNVLVAGRTSIVNAAEAVGTARRHGGVCRDIARITIDRLAEKFIVFSLPA
jgi:hypothetical protein